MTCSLPCNLWQPPELKLTWRNVCNELGSCHELSNENDKALCRGEICIPIIGTKTLICFYSLKIKFVLHVFEHCRSISFCIDIKDEYQSTDRDDFSISHNISQELMLLNVPVNLTIEGYKIELPKSVPIDNRGNCILGTIVLKAFFEV